MTVVRDHVLARIPDPSLRAHLVWVPVLDDDEREAADRAAAMVRDPRVSQWWDTGRKLGDSLGEVLGIPRRDGTPGSGFAWDVYLVYPPGVTWHPGDRPPAPAWWTHQLAQVNAAIPPLGDGEQLRRELSARLVPR